ncbi:MAG: hypothetical protein K8L99_09800 [Anaerolineae bacterium]|nr:hypothetical protein [Anaerolineae bacterium]
MPPMIVIDNEYVTLQYHPDKKIVHHSFKQWIPLQIFRDVMTQGADIFEKYGAEKWLSDDRGNGALDLAAAEWGTKVWTPRITKAGWKYWAVVMPKKVLGQMDMRQWIKMYSDLGVTVKAFTDPDEALRWLEKQ